MMKFKVLLILCFLCGVNLSAQNTNARTYRIKKSQFPEKALAYITEEVESARRKTFYKESDGSKLNFEAKFKKDRLWYNAAFTSEGVLEDISFLIKPLDIPDESYSKITSYLNDSFSKYKIRILQQKYPVHASESATDASKKAFQNLMVTGMVYELAVVGNKNKTKNDYKVTFDAQGTLIEIKKALHAKYAKVLF